MQPSVRNTLKGIVSKINLGAVNAEVVIELPGGSLVTSIVTRKAVETLGLAEGQSAYAIIDALNVRLGVSH